MTSCSRHNKEKEASMVKKSSIEDLNNLKKIEKGFNLPLYTLVEGTDVFGKGFNEKTTLSYISHNGSSFWLENSVPVGSELKIIIDLPPNLAKEKALKLIIKGKVVFIEALKDQNSRHRVSIRFENKYIIRADG